MTKITKFQEGGIMDEDALFSDDNLVGGVGTPGDLSGPLDGELAGEAGEAGAGDGAGAPKVADVTQPVEGLPGAGTGSDGAGDGAGDEILSGTDIFLANYGIKGGIITFEGGETANFGDLEAQEQANILSSLVTDSVPNIEEKYNLDDSEVNLLNAVRDSGTPVEDFINNIVDYRVNSLLATQQMDSSDYDTKSEDAIFAQHLLENDPELTDEEVAKRLFNAKELESYASTVSTFRDVFKARQTAEKADEQTHKNDLFKDELEAQRHDIVNVVEGLNDVAGAPITNDMKEFLLHDIMELNDNSDPILMEQVFSDPESMFKVNWFMKYGEDYITNLNTYWKNEVSKAYKQGYNGVINKMPEGAAVMGVGAQRGKARGPEGVPGQGFGQEMTEEELFREES